MECQAYQENGQSTLKITGNIEATEDYKKLGRTVCQLVAEGVSRVVLDVSKVEYVPASICGLLVSISKKAGECGVGLALIVDQDQLLYSILTIAGISRTIDVYPSSAMYQGCSVGAS